jgi:leucyl-tRNA synthetase
MQAFSYKNDNFKLKEPFDGLFTQGMVCHETYKDQLNSWLSPEEVTSEDGKEFYKKDNPKEKITVGPIESMSKSKKNTIDPEKIIKDYGADAVRLFILSDSPPEKDVLWSDQGMVTSYKFIQKLWLLHQKIKEKIATNQDNLENSTLISNYTDQLVNKITHNLEKFNYNVIVANLYETYNFLIKVLNGPIDTTALSENYKKILCLINPIIPHFVSECLKDLQVKEALTWPKTKPLKSLIKKINFVVQINGKKRGIIVAKNNISEDDLIKIINKDESIKKHFIKLNVNKKIFIKNRLINFISK